MNNSNTLKKIFFDWLLKEYQFNDLEKNFVEISTPFLDNDFDHIVLYAEFLSDGRVTLTDDGWTINNLKSHGVSFSNRSTYKNNLINTIVNNLGTKIENGELCITTPHELATLIPWHLGHLHLHLGLRLLLSLLHGRQSLPNSLHCLSLHQEHLLHCHRGWRGRLPLIFLLLVMLL